MGQIRSLVKSLDGCTSSVPGFSDRPNSGGLHCSKVWMVVHMVDPIFPCLNDI
jgi:hypothetical protein